MASAVASGSNVRLEDVAAASTQPKAAPQPPPYATLLSGAVSGLTSCVLLQPFDLLKTRLQQSSSETAQLGSKTRRLVVTFNGVVQQDGVKGLWRGTWPTILRNVPGVALYFYSVTEFRRILALKPIPYLSSPIPGLAAQLPNSDLVGLSSSAAPTAKPTSTGNLLTGATARVSVGFILCPITVVKTRFESSNFAASANSSLYQSLSSIYAESGVRGLFRGFTATALRDAPYAGLYLMFYEKGKSTLDSLGVGSGDPNQAWKGRAISGLVAGTAATISTHPFDILKTRLQTIVVPAVSSASSPSASSSSLSSSTLTATAATSSTTQSPPSFRSILAQVRSQPGGLSSLFLDGLGLRCARKALSSAIGWAIFEGGRDWWVSRNR